MKILHKYLLKCALYAEIAYYDNVQLHTKNILMYINNNLVEGYVFREKEKLYITFRGLDSMQDCINCVNATPKRLEDDLMVHSGYYNCYDSVKNYIIQTIKSNDDINKVVFIGHSMGGSISTLAAYDIHKHFNNKVSCITFGSPAVGNEAFVTKFNDCIKESFRITNRYDIVPTIPIYKHVNHEIKIGLVDNSIQRSYNIEKRIIKPHKIDYYVELLKNSKNNVIRKNHTSMFSRRNIIV